MSTHGSANQHERLGRDLSSGGHSLGASGRSDRVVVCLSDSGDLPMECMARCLSALLGLPFVMQHAVDAVLACESVSLVILSDSDERFFQRSVLRQLSAFAPVVVFSMRDGPADVLDSLRNGARAHILMHSPLDLAADAIRAVLSGGIYVPAAEDLERVRRRTEPPNPQIGQLTGRQLDVARAVARGTSNKAIASDLNMSESTVKIHIHNIMRKLEARNRTEVALRIAQSENAWGARTMSRPDSRDEA